ncbi:hypothetical protein A6D98_09850 [Aliivibrio fischeri]|uniref:hypothetical protein n=1 Tax=Aliivibrio fischeri TaxID=668 RepID=UPI00080E14E5|nr:hypothetical protein [Aliivibrio fischeri]OCH60893.1 hypothetical protein A6D98_09850 [Aliivibrio fischeri]
MKSTPMIFNTEMVQALLSGNKTVTRRPMKPQPVDSGLGYKWFPSNIVQSMVQIDNFKEDKEDYLKGIIPHVCPIACKGDLIYVRETFCMGRIYDYDSGHPASDYLYVEQCAVDEHVIYKQYCLDENIEIDEVKWKASIHMPKELSRITLKVTDVRIEQVQDITEEQAISEGMPTNKECQKIAIDSGLGWYQKPVTWFKSLWNGLYNNWDDNPYVWVIEFEVIKPNKESVN